MDTYFWFFYIGIFLFVTHLLLNGISTDLSYFGLLLIYLGWSKMSLWSWLMFVLWIFVVIDILATIYHIQERVNKYLDPTGELSKDEEEDGEKEPFDQEDDDEENDEDQNEENEENEDE